MQVFDADNVLLAAAIIAGIQLACFILICCWQLEIVTDVAGGVSFLSVAMATMCVAETYLPRQLLVSSLVSLWAVRLSFYLTYRNIRIGGGERFEDTNQNGYKLIGFWSFQAVWVFTVSLPVIFTNSPCMVEHPNAETFTLCDIIGTLLFGIGFLLEAMADMQKFVWKDKPGKGSTHCKSGLWHWSRHPNYFGEILVWWGIFSLCASVLEGYHWVALLSPVFTTCILLFLSGIPLQEMRADSQYGKSQEYQDYKLSTSVLVPLPPSLYRALPRPTKCLLCCEFPLYNNLERPQPGAGEILALSESQWSRGEEEVRPVSV